MENHNKQECALCLVRTEGRILFVRQAYGLHLWTFPGGTVEPDESFAQAAIRELREETGLYGQLTGLVCFRTRANQTIAVFDVAITGGLLVDAVPGEIEANAWFDRCEMDHEDIEYFPAFVARASFENHTSSLPFQQWIGGSGDADMFI